MLFVTSNFSNSESGKPPRTDPYRRDWASAIAGAAILFIIGAVGEFLYPADISSRIALIDFTEFRAENASYIVWLVSGLVLAAIFFPITWTVARSIKYKYPNIRFYSATFHPFLVIFYLASVFTVVSSETVFSLFEKEIAVFAYVLVPGIVVALSILKEDLEKVRGVI